MPKPNHPISQTSTPICRPRRGKSGAGRRQLVKNALALRAGASNNSRVLFFGGKHRKARRRARDWWELARKVENYRGDLLEPAQRTALVTAREELGRLLRDQTATPQDWEGATQGLEAELKKHGGTFYPRHWWADNAEMILVAAIVAIGIRTFFLQPFKIPTNSMHPSYFGRTAEVFAAGEAPGLPLQVVRFLAFGATRKTLTTEQGGELILPDPRFSAQRVPGRGIRSLGRRSAAIPQLRYTFVVGGEAVSVDVPIDFDMRLVYKDLLGLASENDVFDYFDSRPRILLGQGIPAIRTGQSFAPGEAFLEFDILTGDNLVVDRFSYHFWRPQAGDPFVFRTNDIPRISEGERDQYYIKRLVGTPGDTLTIQEPALWRNGAPIEGAPAFAANAAQRDGFRGYTYAAATGGYPTPFFSGCGNQEIPPESYFVMGDNSPNSADSRMWGFVPEQQAIGRALFIYYPFTTRWGPSD